MRAHTLTSIQARVQSADYEPLNVFQVKGVSQLHGRCRHHGEAIGLLKPALKGNPCPTCRKANQGSRGQLRTFEEWVAKSRAVHGDKYTYVELLRQEAGKHPKLKGICTQHGEFVIAVNNHVNGAGCKKCADAVKGLVKRASLEEIKANIAKVWVDKATYVSHEYVDNRVAVTLNCSKHGNHIKYGGDYLNHGCPSCGNSPVTVTKPTLDIKEYLESLGCNVRLEYPVGRYRFDMLVDDKLLIEFNGNYWHTTEYRKPNTHLEKQRLGELHRYRVIQIFSDEWESRNSQVLSVLTSAVGRLPKGTAARKCQIQPVESAIARDFLDKHHIQGAGAAARYIGLVEGSEIVAVAAYGHALGRARSKSEALELRRYASAKPVVGGLGKVTKYLLTLADTVVSFSDNRMFTGEAYSKAGYKKDYDLSPDYWYYERGRRLHKSNYQKSSLIKRFGADFCEGLSEKEATEKAGIYRIYDAGKVKWSISRKLTVTELPA